MDEINLTVFICVFSFFIAFVIIQLGLFIILTGKIDAIRNLTYKNFLELNERVLLIEERMSKKHKEK